ncbi:MAG: Ni/Fe hydrogenase subunit alpha [Candidatus Sumerlaeota bacterium]|nr:Ni/Fe hydrogenase subunit alpha [Candidatus Sumerlaeota bacterium]
MPRDIAIDPVTRIEGHAAITIRLRDDGEVDTALFHVTQFRGFEKFVEGRPFHEMPSIMARICGICPVAHLIASAKACDQLLAVRIPETAEHLRRMMNMAQMVQSHALSFFHLSSPDLLLGMDSDPAARNLFGVVKANPQLARDGIRLRQFGQQIIEWLGGKRIHPVWAVPGGVMSPLTAEVRDHILERMPEALDIAQRTLDWHRDTYGRFAEEIESFGNFPSLFMGLVTPSGGLQFYDGKLRIVDQDRRMVIDQVEPPDYMDYIGEAVEPFSYLKSPYYKPLGYPQGMYRVGPLARLNIADHCGTPRADEALEGFRALRQGAVLSSFHYHYARLIEILYGLEKIEERCNDPDNLNEHVRAFAEPNCYEGVGACEAPRGTLFHHYRIDRNGLMTWANLVIATGHNNLAMNRAIEQAARHFIRGPEIPEGMLNRVEAVIRCYDPCLSCSTHALGRMPLRVRLVDAAGKTLDERERS